LTKKKIVTPPKKIDIHVILMKTKDLTVILQEICNDHVNVV